MSVTLKCSQGLLEKFSSLGVWGYDTARTGDPITVKSDNSKDLHVCGDGVRVPVVYVQLWHILPGVRE